MILDILGYVFGIGFIVFGISALVSCGSEVYKVISKNKEKGNYKKFLFCWNGDHLCNSFDYYG